jgi:hypothetical protein
MEASEIEPWYTELNAEIVLRYFLFSNFLNSLNLKKEAMYFSETSAIVYKSTRYITF